MNTRGVALAALFTVAVLSTLCFVSALGWSSDMEEETVDVNMASQGFTLMKEDSDGQFVPVDGCINKVPGDGISISAGFGNYRIMSNFSLTDADVRLTGAGDPIDFEFDSIPGVFSQMLYADLDGDFTISILEH